MAEKQEKDLQKVKDLIELMKANDLVEIEIAEGDSKIHLKRPCSEARLVQYSPMMHTPVSATWPAHTAASAQVPPAAAASDEGLLIIKSPIVGTFYQASNPESAPFIKAGDKVNSETVVCIIEAMKVMNEIKAELGGTVVEICCKDGQAVEFGQALFKVRP
jgi:acetyl-CoA carboxylase biotin carboxyl carrier protein